LAFLTWENLLALDPKYEGSVFLGRAGRSERFAERYRTPEARFELILLLLQHARTAEDAESAALANRIVARMQPDSDGRVARPLLYIGTTVDGVAAALAVHDEFWTRDW
jgi:hypothetical protein